MIFFVLNIFYHAAELYENIVGILVLFWVGFSRATAQDYESMGQMFGYLVYWILYDVEDFSYPDIAIDYPEAFEEEARIEYWKEKRKEKYIYMCNI